MVFKPKRSIEGIDITEYVFYFLYTLKESIDEEDLKEGETLEVKLSSNDHKYFYEGVELITRTVTRMGFETRLPKYHVCMFANGGVEYEYVWTIKKPINTNDLPF